MAMGCGVEEVLYCSRLPDRVSRQVLSDVCGSGEVEGRRRRIQIEKKLYSDVAANFCGVASQLGISYAAARISPSRAASSPGR
jgi:hypothetical protein